MLKKITVLLASIALSGKLFGAVNIGQIGQVNVGEVNIGPVSPFLPISEEGELDVSEAVAFASQNVTPFSVFSVIGAAGGPAAVTATIDASEANAVAFNAAVSTVQAPTAPILVGPGFGSLASAVSGGPELAFGGQPVALVSPFGTVVTVP
jgi:hypothetical protein